MQIKYSEIGTEPITSTEVKSWLKVDFTDEDTLISSLITQVRELAEEFSGLSLVVKTIEYFEEDEEILSDWIKLPYPAHDSITEVNGEVVTDYYSSGLNQKRIKIISFLTTDTDDKGLYVKYTTLGTCPSGVKLAMLKEIADVYENRGNSFEGGIQMLSSNFMNFLRQFQSL